MLQERNDINRRDKVMCMLLTCLCSFVPRLPPQVCMTLEFTLASEFTLALELQK